MTIGELKQQVKDYLHVGSSHDATDLVIVNRLALQALNNARLRAEREHDFALAMIRATVSVSPSTGASLASVTDIATSETVSMKSIVSAFLESPAGSGNLYPLTHRPMKTYVGMVQRANNLLEARMPDEWPTIIQEPVATPAMEILTLGGRIYLEPAPTSASTITLHGYRWMPAYTEDADTDFFTEFCSDYMLWQSVIEVNHKLEVFVQRQEGTLTPPTNMRDEAWESALKWDSFMHEEGREHTLGS